MISGMLLDLCDWYALELMTALNNVVWWWKLILAVDGFWLIYLAHYVNFTRHIDEFFLSICGMLFLYYIYRKSSNHQLWTCLLLSYIIASLMFMLNINKSGSNLFLFKLYVNLKSNIVPEICLIASEYISKLNVIILVWTSMFLYLKKMSFFFVNWESYFYIPLLIYDDLLHQFLLCRINKVWEVFTVRYASLVSTLMLFVLLHVLCHWKCSTMLIKD